MKYTFIIWVQSILILCSQNDSSFVVHEKNTIILDEVVLESRHYNHDTSINYYLLRKRVLRVCPYVDSIENVLQKADNILQQNKNKRFKRRYARKYQKKLVKDFGKNIKNLTRKEGVILSKLIYRQFNKSVYQLISDYRGGFQAFLWQNLSKLYEGDLKSTFNPENDFEDYLIDQIINRYCYQNSKPEY